MINEGHHLIHLSDSRSILKAVRYFSAGLIGLIGLKYLINLRWIDSLEAAGQGVWSNVNKQFKQQNKIKSSAIPLGLIRGLLPCGLIYTMLATASSAGSAYGGAIIMFAFGLGTMPSMLSMSAFSELFRNSKNAPWMKQIFGITLLGLAVMLFIFEFNAPHEALCHI